MKYRIAAAMIGMLLSTLAVGQVPGAQTPAQSFSAFKQKLTNVDAWKSADGKGHSLDLMLLASKRKGVFQKTPDGRIQFVLPQQTLNVQIDTGDHGFGIPILSYPAPQSDEMAQKIRNMLQEVQQALDQMNAPCSQDQKSVGNSIELRCSGSPVNFLDYLMDVEVASCPQGSESQCAELDGRRYRVRHAPKRPRYPATTPPLWELLAATFVKQIADGSWAAVDENGQKVSAARINLRGSDSDAALRLVPRVAFDTLDAGRRAEWIQLGALDAKELTSEYVRQKLRKIEDRATASNALQDNQRRTMETVQALAKAPGASTALGAVRLSGTDELTVCTIGSRAYGADVIDSARLGALASAQFRAWIKTESKKHYDHVKPDVDALFAAMQRTNCTVVIDTVPNVLALTKALERDHVATAVLGTSLSAESMANATAKTYGFASDADRQLAQSFGLRYGTELQTFREAGLKDKPAFDAAVARMVAAGYGANPRQVVQFLRDEQEGTRRKMTAVDVRIDRDVAIARRDPFNGMSDNAASYKALGILKARSGDPLKKGVYINCADAISKAENETSAVVKDLVWKHARAACVGFAQ